MSRIHGAIVGCGMISEFHLLGWERIPEVEIVALADPDHQRTEQRRAQFAPRASLYEGIDELLNAETVDFVDIITPPWLHKEHCQRAAKANVHIICQKPLCDNLEDARSLVGQMWDYPKAFAVHENHRFRPWFKQVLHLYTQGCFGTLRFVRLEQQDPREPPEPFKAEAERGVLLEYGVHLVDMMRALLGDPRSVRAHLYRLNPRVRGESLAHVSFEYSETTAVIEVSWKAGGFPQGSALILGDGGEAFYEGRMTNGVSSRFRVAQGGRLLVDDTRSPTDDYRESFYLFQRAFTDALIKSRPIPQPATENLKTLNFTFAAYASAESGNVTPIEKKA